MNSATCRHSDSMRADSYTGSESVLGELYSLLACAPEGGCDSSCAQTAVLLMCSGCNTVCSDSVEVCGEATQLNAIICLRVTKDVLINDELELGIEGPLAGCAYRTLHCCRCSCFVGIVAHSTLDHLSQLRGLFLLHKGNINCYLFKDGATLKSSSLTFGVNGFTRRFEKLKQELEELTGRLCVVERKLKENLGKEG